MSAGARRATVYFDPHLHKALRVKAAQTERSLSDLVNDAVRDVKRRGKLWGLYQAVGSQGTRGGPEEGPPTHRQANPGTLRGTPASGLRKAVGSGAVPRSAGRLPGGLFNGR